MDKLLNKKDLAERWQVSERTIDEYRLSGIVVPIKGLPCIRFNLQYIEKIEGNIPEKITIREKKLEKELIEVKKERDYLRTVFNNIITESNKCIGYCK
ncbi:histidine kinase [Clostridium estertheticum]|uniref:Histidine kinase n=1 Tax=Clostridium estertheticum subsp. estertheticum TaxID=1552 RepID=A0A1J0GKY5_9CLOT|nr:histidine kinase [Clostridium estertheticum]APC41558.1 histidine kinase [Clostridium estertheticum subsp. estertheticum]